MNGMTIFRPWTEILYSINQNSAAFFGGCWFVIFLTVIIASIVSFLTDVRA